MARRSARRIDPRETADLLVSVRACTACAGLPFGPRPIVQLSSSARILVAGQAPGSRAHNAGIPFDDPSGDRLREWLGVDRDTFYDENRIAILPMGFCYPGTGRGGDLPPRPECAALWRRKLLAQLPAVELTLLIGNYAQSWHLPETKGQTVTQTVKGWREHLPAALPLPHPSPRNNRWLRSNPWFEQEVLPQLREQVQKLV